MLCAGLAIGLALSGTPLVTGCAGSGSSGRPRVGGLEPYRVNGKTYVPLRDWHGYEEEGVASWYGTKHHGRKTANGERFDAYESLTAAHKTLPFNVCAEVENLRTGKTGSWHQRRGPFAKGRVIDLARRRPGSG